MRIYDTYKSSGIEWIGEIPGHWEVMRFAYLFSFSRGLGITKQDLLNEGIPCVNYGEIHSKYGFTVDPELQQLKCVEEVYLETSDKSLLRRGDFVFADTSEDIEGSGNFTCLDSDTPTFAGYHTVIARHSSGNSYKFLAYYFDSLEYRNQIRSSVSGIKVYSITQGILKNSNVLLPPPSEQTAIAIYLDRKTAEIDELIADKKRLLELYEEEKTAIINQAVTKGIDPDVPMKDSGIEWLGEIPEHWEVKRLKYVADSYPSNVDKKSKEGEKDVLLCNYINVYKNDFITSELQFMKATASDSQIEKFKLKKGDVIATKDSETPDDIAVPALVREDFENVICGYHLNFIRPKLLIGEYLFRFFQTQYTKGYFFNAANGVTRYGIGAEKFSNFPVCLLSTEEQNSIVHHIKTECSRIDIQMARTQKLIDLLTECRTALISEVVTGKVKVSD
ncbi:MAG: restriction endonuclease subunit S [Anditalea sp.]